MLVKHPSSSIGPIKIESIIQTSCTLSFLPATNNGGAKITSYIIQGKNLNRQIWTQSECVLACFRIISKKYC
ncbi:unnamed protein product [Rotaria sp. Silwood2]|nr:unnamed protein product [Rotaria sp. Silwood2]CAF2839501.1 unnamed protein product [Rotaria sp. Silwood2]CAF2988062.1 unnamed protein product [Rotaria sp. Silwood2]CAF4621697.1 unnamed protein product [Rotaria sp. Silwood2]CAF4627572.1 unnamed protein product [Rotaria sp. Silwood2]